MKNIIIVFLFLAIVKTNAQPVLHINMGVDTATLEHKEILKFWKEYLAIEPSKNTKEHLKFWNDDAIKQFAQPDLSLHSINTEHSIFSKHYQKCLTILSILPYHNEFYQIKTAIGWPDSTKHINIFAIADHYVKKTNEGYKLFSLYDIGLDVDLIETDDYKIYSLKTSPLSQELLDELTEFINKIRLEYDIEKKNTLKIVYGKNCIEKDRVIGLDFNFIASINSPSTGMVDSANDLIVLNGTGSIFHEATHFYLQELCSKTPLSEGIATFYGGSMGRSLDDGLNFLNKYLAENPNTNYYEMLEKGSFHIHKEYNPHYILQGLLIKTAFNKDGVKGIKKLLTYEDLETIFSGYFMVKNKKDYDKFS